MKKRGKRNHIMSALLCSVLFFYLAPRNAMAQDPYAGKLKSYETSVPAEKVKVLRLGYSGLLKIEPDDALFVGDTVKTGSGIKAQIELADGTLITLAPDSNVQIKGFMLDRAQGKRNSVLRALKGTFRFVVSKLFRVTPVSEETSWKDSLVTIETMNAVAGVRGTDWLEVTDKDATSIVMIDGALNVRSATLSQRGSVLLGAGQYSSVRSGGNPTQPGPPPPGLMEELLGATTMNSPITTAARNGRVQKKQPQYTEKDMARDLASDMTLSKVLDKAVEGDMIIQDAIAAALNIGVSPSAVVYTAITEGYPTNHVVEAAVESGAPLSIVLSSALAAGGDKMLVITGAIDAGVPPPVVASTMAAVTTNGGAINGMTPIVITPSSVIPTTLPAIGGGGGATPSTQPASPYKP